MSERASFGLGIRGFAQRVASAGSVAARVIRVLALGVALMLHTPHKLFAAAYAPPIAMEVGPSVIAVGDAVGVTVRPATLPYFGGAKILISWTGSGETSALDTTYYLYYTANASFTGITPGVFDVFASADWSALSENMGLPASSCISTASAPASVTVVDVTNVVASAYHVAEGNGPVTLTAQMTPVNAPEKVFWEIDPYQGGGFFSTNQGLTTQFYFVGDRSSHRVAARCGTSSREVVIHIYRVTGITATPQPAVAGQPITLTAITEPAGCPLPISWNISTNTGATITNAFGVGTHTVTASLGTSTQTNSVVSVGVKEILYEWPANSDNWLSWSGLTTGVPPLPSTAAVAVGSSFRVKAMPEPEGAEFPAGWPVWSGAASGSGAIATATFSTVSTNLSDYQSVTATSGTSSRTEQAVVFGINSILVATNHVAIGTNTLTLTPQMTPSSGGEHLVVWDCTNATLTIGSGASVEFPTDQAGSFTATATCGSSAASTNLYVYELVRLAAAENILALGNGTLVTAITFPNNCPLPVSWGSPGGAMLLTGAPFPIVAVIPEERELIATLGTSWALTNFWFVGVKKIEFSANTSATTPNETWESASALAFEALNTQLKFKAYRDPPEAPSWPAGYPIWQSGLLPGSEECLFTFSPVSSSLAPEDKLEIKASCGLSNQRASATVFNMTLSNVPDPTNNFAGRSYSRFGLGETVVVSNNIVPAGLTPAAAGVTWTPQNGGVVSGWDGVKGTVSGVTEATSIELQLLKRGSSIASNTMQFIAPNGLAYLPISDPTKLADSWILQRSYRMYVLPADVSFAGMEYYEDATRIEGDMVVDLGRDRPARVVPIGAPADSYGSPAEPVKVELFRNLSDDARDNGFSVGYQSATIPAGCRIRLPDDPDGNQVYRKINLDNFPYQAWYRGDETKRIVIRWNSDTFEGFYAPALPTVSPP